VSVPAEDVGDRVLGEAEPVVHPEPIRSGALGLVEGDLLGEAREKRPQAVLDRLAGLDDFPALGALERVAGRPGQLKTCGMR